MAREIVERETVHRRVADPTWETAEVAHVETVAADPYDSRRATVDRVVQAVYLAFGVLEGLLAIRFILKLLGANPAAGFASFIYNMTAPFLSPFAGIFGTPQSNGSVLELHTLVAIVVYALVAWLIARVIWLALGDTRG